MSTKKLQIIGDFGSKVYIQNEEPVDTSVLWIDPDDNTSDFEPVVVDSTLTKSGLAADAEKTGDAIRQLSTKLDGLIHVGEAEPTSVFDGMIWIDTSESQPINNEVI